MPPTRRAAGSLARIVVAALLAASTCTDQGEASPPKDLAPGRVALFDGKGLDGWAITDFGGGQGAVRVEDGAILLEAGRPLTGVTSTREDLPRSDYELTYEARRTGGNDFFAAATFPVGDSFITLINGGWGGNVTGLSSMDGSDASENETGSSVRYETGTWYKFRVRVTAGRIRGWIDETPAFDVSIRDRQVGTRIESRPSQPLGFAAWRTSGSVRSIAIRGLSPAEVTEEAATEPEP